MVILRISSLLVPILLVAFSVGCAQEPSSADSNKSGQGESAQETAGQAKTDASDAFLLLVVGTPQEKQLALGYIGQTWEIAYVPMALEALHMARGGPISRPIFDLLKQGTGQDFGYDIHQWYEWLWAQEYEPHPSYAEYKSKLYGLIDPKFRGYFSKERTTQIRLDEVRWGGVQQDGIPPLREPKMIAADEADYLADDNVVFGIKINGDARAYPKRILAWHEMFVDEVGGIPITGVYCTLCGSMILYESTARAIDGSEKEYYIGTSGFLYRSNKLMYDRDTQSLWSTLEGTPVIGPLADAQPPIVLPRRSVVTTTWGKWREWHPDTTVLSLETGHKRDYGEGVAYRDYFATDEVMFNVPKLDDRLKNKDEVLALTFPEAGPESDKEQLAIAADFLAERPVYQDSVGGVDFVIVTDDSGANRVYDDGGLTFEAGEDDTHIKDSEGNTWKITEDALVLENGAEDGHELKRLGAHRAFWFGWQAAFPETRLVK